ncbi:hypothetical protein BH24ACT5_BH24ACT5_28760 [soil metagenome]
MVGRPGTLQHEQASATLSAVNGRVLLWAARGAWLAVAVIGGSAVGDALSARDRPVQIVGTIAAWLGWAGAAGALAWTSTVTLTVARATVPASLVVVGVALAGDVSATAAVALATPAVVATALVMSAEVGRMFIQASAYGDEERFGLRPPLGYLVPTVGSWLVVVIAAVVAPLAWAGQAWVLGAIATAEAGAGLWVLPRRWHQLSRRWLVLVPAGFVIHDPVVLADTFMAGRRTVGSLALDANGLARSWSADLTGPTPGPALEVRFTEPVTAVLAARPHHPEGTAIHLEGLVVAPTRPGAVLTAAARRHIGNSV